MAGIAHNSAGFMLATHGEWQASNPIVPKRTFAVSSDTSEIRLGDGAAHWADLPVYATTASETSSDSALYAAVTGATFTGDVSVPDSAYDASAWNASTKVPTRNAVRDQMETKVDTAGTGLTKTGTTLAADFGTVSGKVTQGNDSRLSDARTPVAHHASHETSGSDPLTSYASVGDLPPTQYVPPSFPERVVTDLESGHGYTAANADSSSLNDTTDFVTGTQSAKVVTKGDGTATILQKTAGTSFDATDKNIKIRVKIDDITHLAFGTFRVGDTSFTNQYNWNLAGSGIQYLTSGDWVVMTLNWGDATTSGAPTRSAITDWRIEFLDDNTANKVTFHLDGISLIDDGREVWPNGVISICFDDGYIEQLNNGKPVLDTYNYPVTAYVIQENVASGSPNYLTTAQCIALRDLSGWEIAAHASTGAIHNSAGGLTDLNAAQLDANFETQKQWMIDNGFRGLDHLAYPQSFFNNTVITEAKRFLTSARTTHRRTKETWPPADPYRLRSYSVANTDAVSAVKTVIDNATANGQWLILTFHKITTGAPSVSTEYLNTDFQSIVDYIATKNVPVRTIGTVLGTRKPPRPRILRTGHVGKTIDPRLASGVQALGGANRVVYMLADEAAGMLTNLHAYFGTQSGNMSLAVYDSIGKGLLKKPNNRLVGRGLTAGRSPTDGVTNGTATVTSATAAFVATDVGKSISGTNIPANSYIGVVNSGTSIGLSSTVLTNTPVNATGSGSGITLTIGTGIAVPPISLLQQIALDSTYMLDPDKDYWYALGFDNTTATAARVGAVAGAVSVGLNWQQVTFPCPSTAASLTGPGINYLLLGS